MLNRDSTTVESRFFYYVQTTQKNSINRHDIHASIGFYLVISPIISDIMHEGLSVLSKKKNSYMEMKWLR